MMALTSSSLPGLLPVFFFGLGRISEQAIVVLIVVISKAVVVVSKVSIVLFVLIVFLLVVVSDIPSNGSSHPLRDRLDLGVGDRKGRGSLAEATLLVEAENEKAD
uniref:Uncharacterized protein n=1 Tax=Strombidium inclinatum TaxID=197538 RepID=A0A7S3MS29_9SPIT